jgi:hypothetical protein
VLPGDPGRLESNEVVAPAIGAGTVASAQRGRFIEEKELGVGTGAHDWMLVALEGQDTTDPSLMLPATSQELLGLRVVDDPPVSHEGAARIDCRQFPKGINAVLKWHGFRGSKFGDRTTYTLPVIEVFDVDHLVVDSHGSSSGPFPLVVEIKRKPCDSKRVIADFEITNDMGSGFQGCLGDGARHHGSARQCMPVVTIDRFVPFGIFGDFGGAIILRVD